MKKSIIHICLLWTLFGAGGWTAGLRAQPATNGVVAVHSVMEMPIEELLQLNVTSVSKHPEPWFQAASAVFVITSEDIRRAGVTTVPDALRLAPGLQVARVDAHTWAITVRGFNSMFSDKLLVLIDGRTVYTPLFAGVFWDAQDVMLEDVDRIEVIRGPGAALWGANAVNGVINIITKSARQTQGGLVYGGTGTEERGFAGFRYGGKISNEAFFRVYGKWFARDDGKFSDGEDANDNWYQGRGGFRVDWDVAENNLLTLQGELYGGTAHQTYQRVVINPSTRFVDGADVSGGHVLGCWTRTLDDQGELSLQTYYDRSNRDNTQFRETRDTFDIELQYRLMLGERNMFTWGAGYRLTSDTLRDTPTIRWDVASRNLQLVNLFVQDQIALVPNKLHLTLGSKFEHNDFTGFEVQPSGRLAWTPTPTHTVWGAISRAVRTPARSDRDMRFDVDAEVAPGVALAFVGNDFFQSETVIAYEIGWRMQPVESVMVDLATFYNVYQDLRSLERRGVALTPLPPHVVVQVDNLLEAETYGVEMAAAWQALSWWRWRLAYTLMKMDVDVKPGGTDSSREEGDVPLHQVSLRSMMDWPGNLQFDAGARFVDNVSGQDIPSYLVLDVRLAWRPHPQLEVAVVGQNLLDSRHPEFSSLFTIQRTEIEQSVYGKVTWRF